MKFAYLLNFSFIAWLQFTGFFFRTNAYAEDVKSLHHAISDTEVINALTYQSDIRNLSMEKERISGIMRAYGYLDASIKSVKQSPQGVQLESVTGPLYKIGSMEIGIVGSDLTSADLNELSGISKQYMGYTARADKLDEVETKILRLLREKSHSYVEVIGREIIPNTSTSIVLVRISTKVGPKVKFGKVIISGAISIKSEAILRYVEFAKGDAFEQVKLDRLAQQLRELGVFSSVKITYSSSPENDGTLPIHIKVEEAPLIIAKLGFEGFAGALVTALTLMIIALNQIAVEGHSSKRLLRTLSGMSLVLLIATGIFAIRRILFFILPNWSLGFNF